MTRLIRLLFIGLLILLTASTSWGSGKEEYAQAVKRWESGSREDAADLYQKAIASGGLSAAELSEARYNSAVYFFMSKQFDAAMKEANALIEKEPENVPAIGLRASIWLVMGESRNEDNSKYALADWAKALSIDPQDANTYNDRGLYYAEKGDLENAINDLSRFLALEPDNPDQKTLLTELETKLSKKQQNTEK
jgi:tetratricopeptide (TPR) repeat protein